MSDGNKLKVCKKHGDSKFETVEEWEDRTLKTYPDDAPVWIQIFKGREWIHYLYSSAKIVRNNYMNDKVNTYSIPVVCNVIVANHHGKPEVDECT